MADQPKPGSSEAVVTFFTKLPEEYQVPEDSLVVPSSLARYGLSEVVNRLLDAEKLVPFDFLVNGEFLRTSIAQYQEAHKLSSEKVLLIEYVFALGEPEKSNVDEVPDWIAGVASLQDLPSQWFAAVGYDGVARVYEGTQARLTVKLSDGPLTGVVALPVDGGRGARLLASAKDGSAKCCSLRIGAGKASAGPLTSLRGSPAAKSLEAVAIHEDGTLIASGGWDNTILGWNAGSEVFVDPGESQGSGAKRKAAGGGEDKTPKFVLEGHSQVITALQFGAPERCPFTLLSSSWDATVRVWDIAAATCVCNWTVARAVTSFSLCPAVPVQLATAHEDGHVSIWDVRAAPHSSVAGAVQLDASAGLPLASAQVPHRRQAAQVAWCPQDQYRVASVGHDGVLSILDPRSPKMPLQSIKVGKGGHFPTKLLCATWLSRDELAAGGSDGKVVRINMRSAGGSE